jgi:hypothetical protein
MKRRLIAAAALLCALPASGDNALLSQHVINVLTPIDSIPSKSSLNDAFASPQLALDSLRSIALDRAVDVGIQLRAIRALPAYCPQAPARCGVGTTVHDTLGSLIDSSTTSLQTPVDLLRLRAAVEAFGATHSGLASDVDKLVPLLGLGSRDLRATVVKALHGICNHRAADLLRLHAARERSRQVLEAIRGALSDLSACPD